MFNLFAKSKTKEIKVDKQLNEIYQKLRQKYSSDDMSEERRDYLCGLFDDYGYLKMPFQKALEELTEAETLYLLEKKWKSNKVFSNGKFEFANNQVSPLARLGKKNADWIKKEGHDIKLINLAALGNGNVSKETGKFFDWLKQLLILPTGNLNLGILNTTIYLTPFHPREFGCAYLPKSNEVSEKILDKRLQELIGLDVKAQVQTFIKMAQLAGHPVIYDILPQTGRYSKFVLANPDIARWYDINFLHKQLCEKVEEVAQFLAKDHDEDDVQIVKEVYIQRLAGNSGELSPIFQELYNTFDCIMLEHKKTFSESVTKKKYQDIIHNKVRKVVAKVNDLKFDGKNYSEEKIVNRAETIKELMDEGLWPAPGGAWCSAGVPIYDGMSECGGYPMFKHFDYKGDDVTPLANLDCQTPYYFVNLENSTLNHKVIDLFIENLDRLRKDYNFDGFRIDHVDHVVDEISQRNGNPISYRAPRVVLGKLNTYMKKKVPYFATVAEYMLWDSYLKEYHEDMKFELLWGNDIISQYEKTPERITDDNLNLANYNSKFKQGAMLSIIKSYNNQDGEYGVIDQYPAQLGQEGALFKWFKYKFLPGGKYASRPVLYLDGDESYTQSGFENTLDEELSLKRSIDFEFYEKFDAIDRFVKKSQIITEGEAQIIIEDEDGFCAWLITREPMRSAYLVVANYKNPTEKMVKIAATGEEYREVVEGYPVFDREIYIPGDYSLTSEIAFVDGNMVSQNIESADRLFFDKLAPAEFRIFELNKR